MCNKNTAVAIMTANYGTAHVYADTQKNRGLKHKHFLTSLQIREETCVLSI